MKFWLSILLTFYSHLLHADDVIDSELLASLKSAVVETTSFEDAYVAQVWLLDMSNRIAPYIKRPNDRIEFLTALHQEALRANISPELVLSVIHIESRFDRYAISSAGALGIMQIMPFWTKELGRGDDNLFHVNTNLRYGCTILAHYLKREKGNLQRALARYNGSLGKTWYPEKVLTTWEKKYFVNGT